ncbi:MAG: hypothetical protein WCA95_11605 [Opitutaceae bacterium]|jgi:hypothetical protein
MKPAHRKSLAIVLSFAALLCATGPFASARVESEIAPAEKRRAAVELAAKLAKEAKSPPLPVGLSQPFAPPAFELTDAEEAAAAAAAARQAMQSNPSAPAPMSDHQLLEEIVSKVRPSGTIYLGGRPLLMFGKRFVKTGAHFTVTYKGNDYDLELTQIDGTNFTLRYKSDEITRPIQPGKSP